MISLINIPIFLSLSGWKYSCENSYIIAYDISVFEYIFGLDVVKIIILEPAQQSAGI